jgi:hypothetical protein
MPGTGSLAVVQLLVSDVRLEVYARSAAGPSLIVAGAGGATVSTR